MKTVVLTPAAGKDLDALPGEARESITDGLHRYAMTGQGDVKKLSGRDGYRLRIGTYRVIFDEDATTILAIYIGRRSTTTYRRTMTMIPIHPQTIRSPSGEELVVLTRAEFDALAAAVADQLEDADDAAIYDERKATLANAGNPALPAEVSAAMLSGDSLLRAFRRWKGITQAELAERTGLAQGYISDLETRRKMGAAETLQAIAAALEVDPAWLIG